MMVQLRPLLSLAAMLAWPALSLLHGPLMAAAQLPVVELFGPGTNENLRVGPPLLVLRDGSIVVGGSDVGAGGSPRLFRFYPDGALDPYFNPPIVSYNSAEGDISCLALQADGRIILAGYFHKVWGQPHTNIARLNADGSLDATFHAQTSARVQGVSSAVVQGDGKIVFGGSFQVQDGNGLSVGRLNPDGSLDADFNPYIKYQVTGLALQRDGKILVWPPPGLLVGQTRRNSRLNVDGSFDTSFSPDLFGVMERMAVQPDGKILFAGKFRSIVGGNFDLYMRRLNEDGSVDLSFDGSLGAAGGEIYSGIYNMALQADGKILVAGYLPLSPGSIGLARLNPDGTFDPDFQPLVFDSGTWIGDLALQPDGKMVVTGQFSDRGGQFRRSIGRLTNVGTAVQHLDYDGWALTWRRGGTSPEIVRATFQSSADGGVTWTDLGDGERILGGWQLGGISLPGNTVVRALGAGPGWFVESYIGPPVMLVQPAGVTRDFDTTVTLGVQARGTEPLSFRWRKDGHDLVEDDDVRGVTNAFLSLYGVRGVSGGSYSVVVSNALGMVTSVVAAVTINDPVILAQPASRIANAGDDMSFSVSAAGSPPLTFQWLKEGVPQPDATNADWSLSSVQTQDAGRYSVVVTSTWGSVTSAVANLEVNLAVPDDFDPAPQGAYVTGLAVQADGRILMGGYFHAVSGGQAVNLARLNGDGTLDTTFAADRIDNSVAGLALQPDGKILACGAFEHVSGEARDRFCRLNSDGSLDLAFAPKITTTDWRGVSTPTLQPDGRILLGGRFTTLAGQPRTSMGRLNSNGTLDTSFNVRIESAFFQPFVGTPLVQSDGKILLAGAFTLLNGQSRANIGRLNANGTVDATFNPGALSANPQQVWVDALALQPDGRILVGGTFDSLAHQSCTNIGRLNPDGTLDPSFHARADYVQSLLLQADGRILVLGWFDGRRLLEVRRLNPDGSRDPFFRPWTEYGIEINAIALQPDGKVLVGGNFTSLAGHSRLSIGRLNNTEPAIERLTLDGSTLTWLRGGTCPEINRSTFEYSIDGGSSWTNLGASLRVTGGWQNTGVPILATATRFRARGYGQAGLIGESFAGPPTLLAQPAGVTQDFGTDARLRVRAGGTEPLSYQWRKNGQALVDNDDVIGATNAVLDLYRVRGMTGGNYSVVVSNSFGVVTGMVATVTVNDPVVLIQPTSGIANAGDAMTLSVAAVGSSPLSFRWLKDGVPLPDATNADWRLPVVAGRDSGRYSVVITSAWGSITSAVAILEVNLAVPDDFAPVLAPWVLPEWWLGGGPSVYGLAVQPDGRILLGGIFGAVSGQPHVNFARLNGDGTPDLSFDAGVVDSSVTGVALQPDGKILASGAFGHVNGEVRNSLCRLNSDGSLDLGFNPIIGGQAARLSTPTLQPDDEILLGGDFLFLNGQLRQGVGRLNSDGTLDTSFDADITGLGIAPSPLVQSDGRILLAGSFGLARINSDGSPDAAFNPNTLSVDAIALQPDGRILVGGSFETLAGQSCTNIGRLNPDGTLDTSFRPLAVGVRSFMLQADGRILILAFDLLTFRPQIRRFNPDGSLDPSFWPLTDGYIYAMALQPDGKVLVAGQFTSLAGRSRLGIGRLNNTEPVIQRLTLDGSTLTWWRGGTCPEIDRSTFEYSIDGGSSWTSLGAGFRVTGGWQRADVPNLAMRTPTFRTRGYGPAGLIAESFFGPPPTQSPSLHINLNSETAVLSLDGEVGRPYAVEVSSTLGPAATWQVWRTVLLTNTTQVLGGIGASDRSQQFYRARLNQ